MGRPGPPAAGAEIASDPGPAACRSSYSKRGSRRDRPAATLLAMKRTLAITVAVIGLAGCGGSDTSKQTATTSTGPQRSATVTLQPTPTTITTACRRLAASRMLPVLCPTRLPEGRWFVNHRTLRNGRCAYLLDLNTHPFGQNIPFHALAGGRCGLWPLTTRSGRWPARGALTNDLGLIGAKPLRPGQPSTTTPTPVPPRVLRRVDVNGHHGLLLQEAVYPNGGVHGGHLAVIWNQDGNGYVLSLHFTESPRAPTSSWQQIVIDTADTMSRASEPSDPTTGAAQPQPTSTVIVRKPDESLRRRGTPLNLTSALPRSVRRACATAAAKSSGIVYCPPLVPTGATLVEGVNGIIRSRDFRAGFVANFLSRSVRPSRSTPGHWTLAEGKPQTLRTLLHPTDYDPRDGSITRRQLAIADTSATLWLMPSFRVFHGIYGGHAVVTWQCAGREYQVSMHGHNNTHRAILMATALADELPAPCRR